MLYLLDTNVLIEAKNKYYPIDRVPHFWVWILENAEQQKIRIPPQVISEVRRGYEDDLLFEWINVNGESLELKEDWDHQMLDRTLQDGYGFKAHEIASSEYLVKGADPFLIAHALIQPIDRCVVTYRELIARTKQLTTT